MGRQTVLRLILVAWVSVLNFQVLSATPQSAQDPTGAGQIASGSDDSWTQKARKLCASLSLDEKLSQLNTPAAAVPNVKLPAFNWWSEALHGINNREGGGTIFPQPLAMAAAFNRSLLHHVGDIISTEARAFSNRQVQAGGDARFLSVFSPNINIFRDPRWGRGSETYGEDPYLTAELGVQYVKGLQGNDSTYLKIGATCKHFAAYSLEQENGITRMSFNAVISDRDLQETYLPAFEACVRDALAASIMCSYNAVNGVPACANVDLLQHTLREEWGFKGFVVSDCAAVQSVWWPHKYTKEEPEAHAKCLTAGCDMSCTDYGKLKDALQQGLVTEADIDQALIRSLAVRFRLGMFDPPAEVPFSAISPDVIGSPEHVEAAVEAARQSIVLLKNLEDDSGNPALPLQASNITKVVVVGQPAVQAELLFGSYYGAPAGQVTTPLQVIQNAVGADKVNYQEGPRIIAWNTEATVDGTIRAAESADVVIFFAGVTMLNQRDCKTSEDAPGWVPFLEGEGQDRHNIDLPASQTDMLKGLAARTDAKIIVVLIHGGPVAIEWLEASPRVSAIVTAWMPGQGAQAIADVLFGKISPSGRLPVTFYHSNYTQLVESASMNMAAWPGRTHRYLQEPALYPFGYGLSYTSFEYGKPLLKPASSSNGGAAIQVSIRNSGDMAGDEVVLLVLALLDPDEDVSGDDGLPLQSLRNFERISLQPNETTTVRMPLLTKHFQHALTDDEGSTSMTAVHGVWEVQIGKETMQVCFGRSGVSECPSTGHSHDGSVSLLSSVIAAAW